MLVLDRRDVRHLWRPPSTDALRPVRGPSGFETGRVEDGRIVTDSGTRIDPSIPTRSSPGAVRARRAVRSPEIWCAGVTYERSRDARVEESAVKDVYTMVYDAAPELFMKDAMMRRTVGPGAPDRYPRGLELERARAGDRRRARQERSHRGTRSETTCRRETSRARTRSTCPRRRSMPARARSDRRSSSPESMRAVRADAARHRRVGPDRLRGRDVDGADEEILRRARPLADGGQPRPVRQHPPHGHRARSARQLHPASRPLRRDPRPRDRHARQSRRACLRNIEKEPVP